VQVSPCRVEALAAGADVDVATARAVTGLGELWRLAAPRLGPEGVLLALAGHPETSEIAALRALPAEVGLHRLQVPGLAEARHLVAVRAIA
jgi:16S rRNA G527 N7-methylase RsmG